MYRASEDVDETVKEPRRDSGIPPSEETTSDKQNENHIGSHWAVKILFIIMSFTLAAGVGILFAELQDAKNVDIPVYESRYAAVFDGWVDEYHPIHDEMEAIYQDLEEEFSDSHNRDEVLEGNSDEEEEEEHEQFAIHDDDDDDEDDEEDDDDEDDADKNEVQKSQEEELDEQDTDDVEESEEVVQDSEETNKDNETPSSEDHYETQEQDDDAENDSQQTGSVDEYSEEFEEDDDVEDEVIENDEGEEELLAEQEAEAEGDQEIGASMAVKFGVGVALVVVAHLVLVKKWKNGR